MTSEINKDSICLHFVFESKSLVIHIMMIGKLIFICLNHSVFYYIIILNSGCFSEIVFLVSIKYHVSCVNTLIYMKLLHFFLNWKFIHIRGMQHRVNVFLKVCHGLVTVNLPKVLLSKQVLECIRLGLPAERCTHMPSKEGYAKQTESYEERRTVRPQGIMQNNAPGKRF